MTRRAMRDMESGEASGGREGGLKRWAMGEAAKNKIANYSWSNLNPRFAGFGAKSENVFSLRQRILCRPLMNAIGRWRQQKGLQPFIDLPELSQK